MWFLLLATAFGLASARNLTMEGRYRYIQGNNTDETEALSFLVAYDREASAMCNNVMNTQWDFNTNITEATKQRMLETQLEYAKFQKDVWQKATSYAWKTFRDPSVRRQFKVLSVLGRAALPEDKLKEIQQLLADMRDIYSRNRVCPYVKQPKNTSLPVRRDSVKCNLALDPDLTRIMAKSKDVNELVHMWQQWHEETGRPLRSKFIRYVELSNEAARLNGFKDLGDQWRASYDVDDFGAQLEEIWTGIRPLYMQMHAYVRRKLHEQYGNQVPLDGPIPAHLLGNMWAQSWTNLYDATVPFADKQSVDVSLSLKRQGYDPVRMFQLADDFFVSLGMKSVPDSFWTSSMLERPPDREVVCHASAWDFCNGRDFRIKQCTEVNMEDLVTAHHELGHIQYYMQYVNQPLAFREGANPGFHEAIGDVIALSVSTPKHLQKIGLLEKVADDPEVDINYLYAMALDKIAFLPFGYLLDQWRWKVFSGEIPFDQMNAAWWDLRLRYQGVAPPVNRTEQDFDPGAKYHVPANTPYIRYFVSFVLQFHVHKVLCDASGHVGPLHKCDIYQSRDAGRALTELLKLGSSKPWPEAIRVLTRGKSMRMDSGAIMEYFRPLYNWLKEQNGQEAAGWRGMNGGSVINTAWYMVALPLLISLVRLV